MNATVDRFALSAADALAAHHPIGVSTGIFQDARGDWHELTRRAGAVSRFAVELSALTGAELESLSAYLARAPRLPFRYVSVHAPAWRLAADESETVLRMGRLPLWVRSIVAHPDVLGDRHAYRALGTRLVLENMGAHTPAGRTVDELEPCFEALPDAGFCFDIAHAHSLDQSLELSHELLDRYGPRLRHVHLSSLRDGAHVPVTPQDARSFMAVLDRCRDVPWILEAYPAPRRQATLEPAGPRLSRAA